jgi:hypothetical protein
VSDGIPELICGALLLAGFIAIPFITHGIGERDVRKEAVKAGVAEYYLDDHHSKQFRWRTNSGNYQPLRHE